MVDYLLKMLRQPSSYAGLSGFALSLGVAEPAYNVITTFVAAAAGLAAFFIDGNKLNTPAA